MGLFFRLFSLLVRAKISIDAFEIDVDQIVLILMSRLTIAINKLDINIADTMARIEMCVCQIMHIFVVLIGNFIPKTSLSQSLQLRVCLRIDNKLPGWHETLLHLTAEHL